MEVNLLRPGYTVHQLDIPISGKNNLDIRITDGYLGDIQIKDSKVVSLKLNLKSMA